MFSTVLLSMLLMLGGAAAAAAAASSNLQVYGKSVYSDKPLLSDDEGRHTVRRQPHQTKSDTRRSLDLEHLNMHETLATRKSSLPSMVKLFPPTVNPRMHVNMPMRFGRDTDTDEDKAPNSPNLPQRFGRAWKVNRVCVDCPPKEPNPAMPRWYGRNALYWALLNTLAIEQFINTGLNWEEEYGFAAHVQEAEMDQKTL